MSKISSILLIANTQLYHFVLTKPVTFTICNFSSVVPNNSKFVFLLSKNLRNRYLKVGLFLFYLAFSFNVIYLMYLTNRGVLSKSIGCVTHLPTVFIRFLNFHQIIKKSNVYKLKSYSFLLVKWNFCFFISISISTSSIFFC